MSIPKVHYYEKKSLSPRETQVLLGIARGMEVKEIAEHLELTASTTHTYRRRIMEKLDLKNNVEIALYAVRKSLLDVEGREVES